MRLGSVEAPAAVAVIAELGNNHEGDAGVAHRLVEAAAAAGAHAVKLQAIDPPKLVRRSEMTRMEQLERFRLPRGAFVDLAEHARTHGMSFVCTPFDTDAVQWLEPIVDAYKIASGDNDVMELLEAVAATGKPVIFSTGMSDRQTILAAKDALERGGAAEVAALHCVSAYPVEPVDASLATIPALERELGGIIGWSDHALGIEVAVGAAAVGARIIEKHFTLDQDFSDFRDHQLSADPDELRRLVDLVARPEALEQPRPEVMGTPRSGVLPAEQDVARAARRSLTAARDLEAGRVLLTGDLVALRPGDGLPPPRAPDVVGRRLSRALRAGDPIRETDVR